MYNEFVIVFGGSQTIIIIIIVFSFLPCLVSTALYETNPILSNIHLYEKKGDKNFNLMNYSLLTVSSPVRDYKDVTGE